jgi:hypothetical protein
MDRLGGLGGLGKSAGNQQEFFINRPVGLPPAPAQPPTERRSARRFAVAVTPRFGYHAVIRDYRS